MGIRFGLFSDLHCSLPNAETRGNSFRTLEDLQKGLTRFADAGVQFAVALGDNLQPSANRNEQYKQMEDVLQTWYKYGFPVHLSFGNHEFQQLSLEDMLSILQTDRSYYSFSLHDIRFIILDSTYNPDGSHFSEDNFDWSFGIIPEEEKNWLKKLLSDKKRTFLFTHYNLYFDPAEEWRDCYMVRNCEEICDILEESGCVEAVFQGHHHTYAEQYYKGIYFINVPSPERSPEYCEDDFPIVDIQDKGFTYNDTLVTQ